MKDSEFIQLLNLYLDHEISPADAVRLEAAVQSNPARRRVYQQYCRMQKACKLLTSEFESEAATATPAKVVPFEDGAEAVPRRAMGGWYALGGFAAAAACVAIVFIGRGRQGAGAEATLASTVPAPAQVAPAAVAKTAVASIAVPAAPRSGLQRSSGLFAADTLLLANQTSAQAVLASASQADQSQFNWIKTLEIAPMQQQRVAVDELRFDVRPASLQPDGRALGNRTAVPTPGNDPQEMVILQFSR